MWRLIDGLGRYSTSHGWPALLIVFFCVSCPVVMSQSRLRGQPPGAVEVVGGFSRITHTSEDAFGYALQLWKQGDQVFGLFMVYTGAPADPPTGILEDIKFDPRTGRLSFSARLTTGLMYSREYAGVPSRARFTFDGVLRRRQVIGKLKQSDELFPNTSPITKRITLRWSKLFTESMHPAPATYSTWESWAAEILRRRGPKW